MSVVPPENVRASDDDRNRVVALLDQAYADGRLTLAEHEERTGRALAARTHGDLTGLTADLGAGVPGGVLASSAGGPVVRPAGDAGAGRHDVVVGFFGSGDRRGAFSLAADTQAYAVFGGVDIDLTEAMLESRTTRLTGFAVFGGITLVVPPGVRVVKNAIGIFGGTTSKVSCSDPDAPVVEVRGLALFGGIEVREAGAADE